MTLKKYLRPEEAAAYLSKALHQDITLTDLHDLCRENRLQALIYYSGRMALPDVVEVQLNDSPEELSTCVKNYAFEGYFRGNTIGKLVGEDGYYPCPSPLEPYELVYDGHPYTGPDHKVYVSLLTLWPIDTAWVKPEEVEEHTPSILIEDHLYFDKYELNTLIQQHKADSTPPPAPVAAAEPAPQVAEVMPEALNAKARTTALQIIAALASYQDALDLTQHYKSADILTTHAASTGQPLPSTETVAQWLKAANPK